MITNLDLSAWFLVKLLFLSAFLLYVAFAGIVVRQINLMTNTLEVGLEGFLRLVSWMHFAFAVGVFILAVLIL